MQLPVGTMVITPPERPEFPARGSCAAEATAYAAPMRSRPQTPMADEGAQLSTIEHARYQGLCRVADGRRPVYSDHLALDTCARGDRPARWRDSDIPQTNTSEYDLPPKSATRIV
jgi:hypothetical protein